MLKQIYKLIYPLQQIASKYNISDISIDSSIKTMQLLEVTKLTTLAGRGGNDAVDENSAQFELKSLNRNLTSDFSTSHHLNNKILAKYRQTNWIFGVFDGPLLNKCYFVHPESLNPVFAKWESQLKAKDHLNNPKISMRTVEELGHLIFNKRSNKKDYINDDWRKLIKAKPVTYSSEQNTLF